jgi:hypothetical protein
MSRGLGRRQRIFLQAVRDLTAADGPGFYRVWAITEAAYRLAPDLQAADTEQARQAAQARADREKQARAGDARARRLNELQDMLRATAPRTGRKPRRRHGRSMERAVNPSRVLASLERRGLLQSFRGAYGLAHKSDT